MRVVQVHTRYRWPGGEDRVAESEARLLRSQGVEVFDITTTNPEKPFESGVALLRAPWNTGAAKSMGATIRDLEPDVIQVHNTWFATGPAIFHSLHAEAPVVATLHNYRWACANALLYRDGQICLDCVGNGPWRGVLHRCYHDSAIASLAVAATTAAARRTGALTEDIDLVLVHSPFAEDIAIRSGFLPSATLVRDNFVEDPGKRSNAPSESEVVVAVGRLSPDKGFGPLIEAWNRAKPPYELLVLGDGPERERLAQLAGPGVHVMGRRPADEVRTAMLSARALAFPSVVFESQPLVILEGMAAGLPVFLSDHPSLRWIVADLGEKVMVTPGNIDAWVSAFAHLDNGPLMDEIGRISRRTYQARFSPGTGGETLMAAYARAIDGHRNH